MAIVALPYPIQLINGNVADGGQVQSDLNYVASQINANAAKNGVNSDITSLTALISITGNITITGATFTSATINTITVLGGTLNNVAITNSTIDGNTTVPTQPAGTSNGTIASTQFATNLSFAAALPAQAGNAGKVVTTNGSVAFWAFLPVNPQFNYRYGAF
jgi:hypothetical protein